jgi:septum formation protein
MADLLLASGSSRRKELLEQIGVQYKSASMDIDESVLPNEQADKYVERLAREKALAGLDSFEELGLVILAADTSVVLGDQILGKPKDREDAFGILKSLSNREHTVLTGIALAKRNISGEPAVQIESQVVSTKVRFNALTDEQIEQYIQTGEPMDKAGAYGIQGKGALFVAGIRGSYSNVVGLPLAETGKMLQRFNVPVWAN